MTVHTLLRDGYFNCVYTYGLWQYSEADIYKLVESCSIHGSFKAPRCHLLPDKSMPELKLLCVCAGPTGPTGPAPSKLSTNASVSSECVTREVDTSQRPFAATCIDLCHKDVGT